MNGELLTKWEDVSTEFVSKHRCSPQKGIEFVCERVARGWQATVFRYAYPSTSSIITTVPLPSLEGAQAACSLHWLKRYPELTYSPDSSIPIPRKDLSVIDLMSIIGGMASDIPCTCTSTGEDGQHKCRRHSYWNLAVQTYNTYRNE